jgi:broad specificity phosphatase PhoE
MGTLYLVRHGQASFGADDYDQLSELGHRQAHRLGEHFAHAGVKFDALMAGTLLRQQQTLQGILSAMGEGGEHLQWEGLNEYDSLAVIATIHPEPLVKPDSPEVYRQHFRLLRQGLAAWMAGTTQPRGMPSWVDFSKGVATALDHVRAHHHGKNVLLVSSGGPIATAVSQVLGVNPETTIELNLRIRNTAVTEFAFTPKRHMLVSYNALPHLDARDHAGWITYA